MNKIYVDLGAYNGDTYLHFINKKADADSYKVYLFEPNPRFASNLTKLRKSFPHIVEYSTKAAWTSDGERKFALDHNELAYGSTLMEGKRKAWQAFDKVTVETFDFPTWTNQFKEDYLIVKMDIEGAEFPILEKMLKDGSITNINELWCEFHPNKVVEYTTTYTEQLIEKIRKQGVEVTIWH